MIRCPPPRPPDGIGKILGPYIKGIRARGFGGLGSIDLGHKFQNLRVQDLDSWSQNPVLQELNKLVWLRVFFEEAEKSE